MDVHLRRHVHDVPRARHELEQPLGTRDGPLWLGRLHRVNDEVARAHIAGAASQDRLPGLDGPPVIDLSDALSLTLYDAVEEAVVLRGRR